MIEGLENSFQCSSRDAIRIALYELQNPGVDIGRESLDRASNKTTITGHTARSRSIEIRLSKTEKEAALQQATELHITEKVYLRLAVIWMARGIKDGTIRRITRSRKKSQLELFREWSKTYADTGSKLKALKDARDAGRDLKIYLDEERLNELSRRSENPAWLNNEIDEHDLEEDSLNNEWLESLGPIEDEELLIIDKMRRFGLTHLEASLWVEDELAEWEMIANMKPRELLAYFKREDQLKEEDTAELRRNRAAAQKDLLAKQRNPSNELKREARISSHEHELTRIIRKLEDEADREAYLGDPTFWDDDTP